MAERTAQEQALEKLRAAVRDQPGQAAPLFELGVALLRAGQVGEAKARLRRAAQLAPNQPEVLFALGNAQQAEGEAEAAADSYAACLALAPTHLAARLNLGALLAQGGELAAAAEHFDAAARAHPQEPAAARNLAQALTMLGRRVEAANAWLALGHLTPEDPEAPNQAGLLFMDLGRAVEAAEAFQRAVTLRPDRAGYHSNLGNALLNHGDLCQAQRHYQTAVELDPAQATAFFQWARASKHALASPEEIAGVEAVLRRPGLAPADRSFFHFALGKIYDDSGFYDAAWEHYARGNRLEAQAQPFDAAAHDRYVESLIEFFTAERLNDLRGLGTPDTRPVLIVGLPRSGTTLVEQILASHSRAHGAGELTALGEIEAELATTAPPYPGGLAGLSAERARESAGRYLGVLARGAGQAAVISDKMPHNFLRLGLAATLLPRARVIHCRREPLDTCLSIYFQKFSSPNAFAYDLVHIAAFYHAYRRLMAHWRQARPLPILEIDYEEMVADQEGQTRRLLGFCGLAWEDNCREFFRTKRQVATSSSWQVRQPMYNSSVARWRNYEKHLAPLRKALAHD